MLYIYVAGPVTGVPDYNRKLFFAIKKYLSWFKDVVVVTPTEMALELKEIIGLEIDEILWNQFMSYSIAQIAGFDVVVFTENYYLSAGCLMEEMTCKKMGIERYYLHDFPGIEQEIVKKYGGDYDQE